MSRRDRFRTLHWMVRTSDMRAFRPIPEQDLIDKIEAGEISANDELCPAGGYWFMLSEVSEVRQFLGDIDLTCLSIKLEGERTSSTDTLPSQKTSLIHQKVGAQVLLKKTDKPFAEKVYEKGAFERSEENRLRSSFEEPRTSDRIFQDASQIRNSRKFKNAVGVSIGAVIFILVLVWFWSGSY